MLSNASSIASSITKDRTMVDYDNTKVENKIKMYYYVLVLVINSSIAISIAKHRTMLFLLLAMLFLLLAMLLFITKTNTF